MLSYSEWFHLHPEWLNTGTVQHDSKDIDIAYLMYCVGYLSDRLAEIHD